MKKLTILKPSFKKSSLEPDRINTQSLPFMFAAPSIPALDLKQKLSFATEIVKVRKIGPILEKNLTKSRGSGNYIIESCLPYKRRARSFSPPKDPLKIIEKNSLFFPMGAPIIPVPRTAKLQEDSELKSLKEEYLKMLETAHETIISECDEGHREEMTLGVSFFDFSFQKNSNSEGLHIAERSYSVETKRISRSP